VFGAPGGNSAVASGSRLYLPVAGDGFVKLAELNFSSEDGPGLFGNKNQLLDEWRKTLGLSLVAPQGSDEQL
jgi:hypothetical protein